jgi:hypothetical protein
VAQGTPAELTRDPQPRLRFRLASALNPEARTALADTLTAGRPGGHLIDDGPARYRFDGIETSPDLGAATVAAELAVLAAWCAERGVLIAEIRTTGSSLEERYLELTGGQAEDA